MLRRFITICTFFFVFILSMPYVHANIYYDADCGLSFTVNGVSLPAAGYELGKPHGNCWEFANDIYYMLWKTNQGNNLLRNLSGEKLEITAANTARYIRCAQLGANIRVEDGRDVNQFDEIASLVKPNAELYAVRGNCDYWAHELPISREFELCGKQFFLIHNVKEVPANVNADIVISGHSHKYSVEEHGGKLWLNSGSCGRKPFNLPLTMMVLAIDRGECIISKINIESDITHVNIPEKNLLRSIEKIMQRMDKGDSIAVISDKLKLERKFVEYVARIRVTHHRVDAEGIMNKIEVNQIVMFG